MVTVTARSRVEDLVPGDLSAIASARDALGAGIGPIQDATATLTGLQVQGWTGVAADRFAQLAPREAQQVGAAATAFSRSASAMSRWESAFTVARAAAQEAINLAARAESLTAQARTEYQTALTSAQALAAAGTPQSQPVTFVDRGASLNAQAQTALASALTTLNSTAVEVAAAIRPTSGWPPSSPEDRNGWDKVLFFPSDMIWTGIVGGVVDIFAGISESAWWVFETFDPFRFVVDQINGGQQWSDAWWANFTRRFGEIGEGIAYVFTNPGDVVGAMLAEFFAVDLWEDEPGAAFGRVVLNIALLATGIGGFIKGIKSVTTTAKVARLARIEAMATDVLKASKSIELRDGRIFVNGVDKMSLEDWASAYQSSIHNMDAGQVTLGKYFTDSPESYEKIAEASGDAYFSMPSSATGDLWTTMKSKYGLENGDMFELFNRPFLVDIVDKKLPVRFTVDPAKYPDAISLNAELEYLISRGYDWDPDTLMATW